MNRVLGQISRACDVGVSQGYHKVMWHACVECAAERWVLLRKGEPESNRCYRCSRPYVTRRSNIRRGPDHWHWRGGRSVTKKGYIEVWLPPSDPLPGALVLCGSEFGLTVTAQSDGRRRWVKRHRQFESSVFLVGAGGCNCSGRLIGGVYGHGGGGNGRRGWQLHAGDARTALGIDWMNRDELSQAIPPAYTQFVGEQLLAHLALERAA